jgi:hypothetical protein
MCTDFVNSSWPHGWQTVLSSSFKHNVHSHSDLGGVKALIIIRGVHCDSNKVVSVRGMKSSAQLKTWQNSEVTPNFDVWRSFSRSSYEDTSDEGLGDIIHPFLEMTTLQS